MAAAKKAASKAAPKAAAKVAAPAPAPAPVAEAPAAAPAPAPEPESQAAAVADAAQPGDQEDPDMADVETIKPAEGEAFVLVRKGLERFHRCGMRFHREPTVLVIAELGEGVLERLKAEPNLLVVEG